MDYRAESQDGTATLIVCVAWSDGEYDAYWREHFNRKFLITYWKLIHHFVYISSGVYLRRHDICACLFTRPTVSPVLTDGTPVLLENVVPEISLTCT